MQTLLWTLAHGLCFNKHGQKCSERVLPTPACLATWAQGQLGKSRTGGLGEICDEDSQSPQQESSLLSPGAAFKQRLSHWALPQLQPQTWPLPHWSGPRPPGWCPNLASAQPPHPWPAWPSWGHGWLWSPSPRLTLMWLHGLTLALHHHHTPAPWPASCGGPGYSHWTWSWPWLNPMAWPVPCCTTMVMGLGLPWLSDWSCPGGKGLPCQPHGEPPWPRYTKKEEIHSVHTTRQALPNIMHLRRCFWVPFCHHTDCRKTLALKYKKGQNFGEMDWPFVTTETSLPWKDKTNKLAAMLVRTLLCRCKTGATPQTSV